MLALRFCAFILQCLLCFGCVLDESPSGKSANATHAPDSGSVARRFVPRDPGVRTQNVQAGSEATTALPIMSMRPSVPQAAPDAGVETTTRDAGASPVRDAGRVLDAGSTAPDAPIVQDASAPPARDAEAAQDAAAPTSTQPPQPIHQYDFSGSERVAVDRIGEANAELRGNARFTGSGEVQLGETEQDAVALPIGILAGLQELTMIGWLTVRSDECWQRLVDFFYYSEQTSQDGQVTSDAWRLYLTPISCPDGLPTAGYVTQQSRARAQGGPPLAEGRRSMMLGAMYNFRRQRLQLIVDGVIEAEITTKINQRQLERARARLGTSFDNSAPVLKGSISEFRIYAQTFDAATLREIARRGPDRL